MSRTCHKIYDESLYDQIRDNFDNRDTLVTVLTDAFDRTYALMVDAGQANLALLMVGGAWVEGHVSHAGRIRSPGHTFQALRRSCWNRKNRFELSRGAGNASYR
ncbi:MAG: hypothetical protein MZV63_51740 [Marinilabiliales bacterium]|nr:hypothetical protein [Marinilabiliales bacterium]